MYAMERVYIFALLWYCQSLNRFLHSVVIIGYVEIGVFT